MQVNKKVNIDNMKKVTNSTRVIKKLPTDEKRSVTKKRSNEDIREKSLDRHTEKKELSKSKSTRLINKNTSNLGTNLSSIARSIDSTKTQVKNSTPSISRQPTRQSSNAIGKNATNNKSNTQKPVSKKSEKLPTTPTSSRVSTSKYFSQKTLNGRINTNTKIISDVNTRRERARKMNDSNEKIIKPPRSRSRTLSPSEIKILKNPNVIQNEEVTIDATSIELNQIDDVSKLETKEIASKEEYDDYEDDFESYESDFEQCSSSPTTTSSSLKGQLSSSSESEDTSDISSNENNKLNPKQRIQLEEEKKLDSGNYDLPTKYTNTLHKIKEGIEQENSFKKDQERHETSFSDEGFDEKTVPIATKSNFINFESAKQVKQKLKQSEKIKKRGEDILNMITLDIFSETLLEMLPIPYEIYMLNYGRGGTQQMYCQTNDDALSEEVQTDEIELKTRWTQIPTDYIGNFKNMDDILNCKNMLEGAGEENPIKIDICTNYNSEKLNKFLMKSGQVILKLLSNEKQTNKFEKTDLPFSLSFRTLKMNISFLKGRAVRILEYSDTENVHILTVHQSNINEFLTEDQEMLSRPMICVWSLFDLSTPNKILICSDEITAACFQYSKVNLLYAGLKNGAICVWNLKEAETNHACVKDDSNCVWRLRSPTYVTTVPENGDQVEEIVKIKSLSMEHSDFLSAQICSLNKTGQLIIWSVVTTNRLTTGQTPQDQGLAYWGAVRLVPGLCIDLNTFLTNLNNELECFDLQFDSKDPHHLYVATNSGYVIHCLTSGTKTMPKFYYSNAENATHTVCIEPCPYQQPYFLVGCKDGTVCLHCRQTSKSLMIFYGNEKENINNGIKHLQWCKSRPYNIFSIDFNNTLHIWDLESSDIYPMFSVPFKKNIIAMKLLPVQNKKDNLMVIAFENGVIQLHELRDEFISKTENSTKDELEKLLFYLDIL